ncbi:hypothetical protein GAYE_SCF24G4380 [Galdieria yellowstonensis]|uniref:S-adenosyl-methyltransferase n=1 Tax=Galdieria yellowstonensis TaxID=3028027 RepID=A0AAV9IGB4_9RHOD|nr:hypothetical protein GAYE_SCF24G4380 [Galdieria yellowstonensis]
MPTTAPFFLVSSSLVSLSTKPFFCFKRNLVHRCVRCYSSLKDRPSTRLQDKEKELHIPVLVENLVEFIDHSSAKGKVFVDCTVGAGGHCERIMELGLFSKCIAIDKDQNCGNWLKERNLQHPVRFVQGSFACIDKILSQEGISSEQVGFILADLGVSSMQLDDPQRGFSFSKDGPLDMRIDLSLRTTAWNVVNQYSEEALCKIIRELGEDYKWRQVAAAIVKEREKHTIDTTCQLAEIVCKAKRERPGYSKLHPATLTFQSLRLFVNNELSELDMFVPKALSCLGMFGRLAVISFHSLEDRIVKQSFKNVAEKGGQFRILTKKPIVPSEEEKKFNVRSRSAKLRVVERLS